MGNRLSEDRRIKALPRIVLRLATGTAAFLIIAFAALVLWLRYVALPSVDDYRGDIVARLEKATGTAVSVKRIEGGWGGLRPTLTLEGLHVADRRGRTALAVERAHVVLSWWALAMGEVSFHDIDIYRPALALRRGKDGLIYLADKPLNEGTGGGDDRLAEWLLTQPRVAIHEATLAWRDELGDAPEIQLADVEIAVRRHRGRHRAALTAAPPAALAKRIDLRAELEVHRAAGKWTVSGDAYGETLQADLARLRAHLPLPESLRNGVGSLRVWAKLAPDGLKELIADMRMRDARLQLADDATPLELASLAGRVVYRAQPQGFFLGTEGLRFRIAGGAETQPGNFSVMRATDAAGPHGEVQADGIDLKIAATLLDHFPVPKDLKAQVVHFAPRGRISKAVFTWKGDTIAAARTYAIKGRFENLGVSAVDRWPGVTNLTGTVEGDEKAGAIRLDSTKAALDFATVFRAPIQFERLDAAARWKREGERLEVTVEKARFANADAEGELAGTWHSLPSTGERKSPGYVDLKGNLTRGELPRTGNYFPEILARSRAWLDRSVLAGRSTAVRFELKGDLLQFPFAGSKDGLFLVEGDIRDGRLRYHPDWPSVDAVKGTFRFEGTSMQVRIERAAIFESSVTSAVATIEDFRAKPAVLVIDGLIDTSGSDSVRFLRESPLVNGPGAFTRVVAIEGPAHLKLHLAYSFSTPQAIQVAGEYRFDGAMASVGKSLSLRDVRGNLAFTESGVSAPQITGTMFGHPAVLRLSTEGRGGVLATLDGRIDAAAMRAHLSDALAARFTGAADWRARLVSSREGSELAVASDLQGLAVALPEPLAKSADESRPLAIVFAHLGAEDEVATVNAGKGVHARFGKRGERLHAALKFGSPVSTEEVRDGLWLYGSLPSIDIDAWQEIFPARGAAPPVAESADLGLRGIDLRLGKVHYVGRDFTQVAAALSKTGDEWSGSLQGPMVAGEVRWSPVGSGRIAAKLQRLAIGESSRETPEPPPDTEKQLPAIDVTAERFEFRGHALGKLEIKAETVGDEWRIERLNITSAPAQFVSSGGWRRTGAGSITTLALKVDSENLNGLLGAFGYEDYVKRGSGHLEGTLVWPGLPSEFALNRLSGSFRIEARRGQFAKIEPGAGKLLGLLSLQSLPRRATFDFRDVFSEGFAFERINADVKVARGILMTDNFEISGPAAFVTLAGEVSLPQETQTLTMHVVPEVSEGVALAATLIGTPVLGLSTLVVSKLLKNPFGKVVAYEYLVTGSWDNPTVTRTSGAPPKPAAEPGPPT
jgi:uncharacterized protein (TIGR02099 family)